MATQRRIPFSVIYQNPPVTSPKYIEYQIEVEAPVYEPDNEKKNLAQKKEFRGVIVIDLFGDEKI